MKVSEIQAGPKVRIEKRNDDAQRYLYNDEQKAAYIREFGDVEVVYDAKYGVYRVPSFAESISQYNRFVSLHCDSYGCE